MEKSYHAESKVEDSHGEASKKLEEREKIFQSELKTARFSGGAVSLAIAAFLFGCSGEYPEFGLACGFLAFAYAAALVLFIFGSRRGFSVVKIFSFLLCGASASLAFSLDVPKFWVLSVGFALAGLVSFRLPKIVCAALAAMSAAIFLSGIFLIAP